jgi:hypothetical protein
MTCDESKDRLLELISGELAAHDEEAVRRHLTACADCRAELAELESISALVRDVPLEEPPARLDRAILERAQAKAAEFRGEAPKVVASLAVAPEARGYWHGLALQIGRFISGPQVAMATVMVLIVAIGVWYGPMSGRHDESLGESAAPGEIVADETGATRPATPAPDAVTATQTDKEEEEAARNAAAAYALEADERMRRAAATGAARPPASKRRQRSADMQVSKGMNALGSSEDMLDGLDEASPSAAQAPAYARESKADTGGGASLGALAAPASAPRDEAASPTLTTARILANADSCEAAVVEYGRFIAASRDPAMRAVAYREQAACYSKLGNAKDASTALALAKVESAKVADSPAKRARATAKSKKAADVQMLEGLE